jgi:3'(2'), 5'-bisphosphate nucleotidase
VFEMLDRIKTEDIIEIVREAGEAVLRVYRRDCEVELKDDRSPLTEADRSSNRIILERLKSAYPDIPFISEETAKTPYSERKDWDCFWLIDPLDGTKEFIKRNGEFTVNIALVRRDTPVLGFVHRPTTGVVYYARQGRGSFRVDADGRERQIRAGVHYSEADPVRVVASRSHLTSEVVEFVDGLKEEGKGVDFVSAGSSLKLCLVAEGSADVYPRLGPTMEWDTAAAHAVAAEAGRKVLEWENREPLRYNKEDLLNPWFIVE